MLVQEQFAEEVKIDPKSFNGLRKIILEKSGISVAHGKEYLLETRLANRLEATNCNSFEEYYFFLRYEREGEKEIERMIQCVTTNETYFFRENNHFRALEEVILPKIMARKEKSGLKTIRLWSAASSTGAEPYTIAIILKEMGLRLSGFNVDILASDINNSVIESARRGLYGETTLRKVPPELLRKYFTPEGSNMRINDSIKSMVRFANLNLIDDNRLRTLFGMDVIFCKNVMIYFDKETKKRVLDSLYNLLSPSGYLFVSLSESLHDLTRSFRPENAQYGIVYQKE